MALLEEILVDTRKTALVVVDLVNDIFADWGRYKQKEWGIKPLQEMVEKSLLQFIDKSKGIIPIVFIKSAYTPFQFEKDEHPITHFCVEGTEGADFYKLNPKDATYIYTKHHHSALFEFPYEDGRTTELHKWLHEKGIKTLALLGATGTNCIPKNAEHAHSLGYRVVIVKDCIASRGQRMNDHELNIKRYEAHPQILVVNSSQILYKT